MAEDKKKDKKPAAPKKKLDRDSRITLILSAILLVLTITGLILFFVLPNPEPAPQVPVVTDIPEPKPEPEPESKPESDGRQTMRKPCGTAIMTQ